jgi:transposase-like protein
MKINKDKTHLENSEIIEQMPMACSDELAAVEFLEERLWKGEPHCTHCQSKDVYMMKGKDGQRNKRFLWRCHDCHGQFTVRIGTVFEESRIPLRHWCYAFWRASTSKKGVSALEIKRQCQLSYQSALFLMHRIRFAMKQLDTPETPKLGGDNVPPVEVDETYVGGKPHSLIPGKRIKGTGYRKDSNKVPVVALIERGGDVRTKVVARVNQKNLASFLKENISRGAVVNTDQHLVYPSIVYPIVKHYGGRHYVVNHGQREYARITPDGTVAHVNTCESFFSLLKRGLVGTFHAVSREHLHRYCDEFSFRWNTRKLNDGERTALCIEGAAGKRLAYYGA